MIETNYQVTCDACEAAGDQPMIVNSQIEFGEITLRTFRKNLHALGWRVVGDQDHCPGHAGARPKKKRKKADEK